MTIIPLIVLAQFSTDLINSNMTQRAKSQLELNVKITKSKYDEELNSLKNLMVQGMSTFIEESYSRYKIDKNNHHLSQNLEDIIKKSEINYLFIIDKNREVLASANTSKSGYDIQSFKNLIDKVILSGEIIASTDIFQTEDVKKQGGKLTRQAQIQLADNEEFVLAGLSQVVAIPIFDQENEVEAITIAGKLLAKDYNIPDSLTELTGATIMLAQNFDKMGSVVVTTNLTNEKGNRAIGRVLPPEIMYMVYGLKITQVKEWLIREFQLVNYYPLTGIDGNIVGLVYIGVPEKQFTLLAEQNVLLVSIISVIGLFAAILLSAIFSRSITTPILKLADAANKVSLGDLGIRVNVRGSFEIAKMGEAFNLMAENLQREERLRDDFVATLTHDLKVPLLAENQTITYMLKGTYGEINEEQKEVLEVIKHTNEETLDMVNTLLEVYRYDAGKNTLLKSEIDIREAVKAATQPLAALIEEKRLELYVNMPDTRVIAEVDEREFKRVIHNLVANAISSTLKRGTIRVTVTEYEFKKAYSPDDKEFRLTTLKEIVPLQNKVMISVYDTGIGMEKEDMENLFKRFSGNKGRKPSSTGLGLYYTHQVITAHGGEIWAESQEGVGTVFKFTLPLSKK
jgi:signal transduction histidine kinase